MALVLTNSLKGDMKQKTGRICKLNHFYLLMYLKNSLHIKLNSDLKKKSYLKHIKYAHTEIFVKCLVIPVCCTDITGGIC